MSQYDDIVIMWSLIVMCHTDDVTSCHYDNIIIQGVCNTRHHI